MLVFEFCAENLTFIDKAIAAGAGRIELCDNLSVGGTTPSIGVINEAIKLTREKSVVAILSTLIWKSKLC